MSQSVDRSLYGFSATFNGRRIDPSAVGDAALFDRAFWAAGTASLHDPRIPDTVSHLRECYANGWIDLEELEVRLPKAIEEEGD